MFKDPKFVKDREALSGRSWKKEDMERGRAQALPEILGGFQFLEGLFGDGREWVLGTKDVSIGDIEGERTFDLQFVGLRGVWRQLVWQVK